MKTWIFLAVFILCIPAQAFSREDYADYSGYVDFGKLSDFKESEESVEIHIGKPLLSLVAALNEQADTALTELLSKLVLIRVEQFSIEPGQQGGVNAIIERVTKKLLEDRWDVLVRVKEPDERVEIFIKTDGEKIAGFLLMSLEASREAAFINIVGDIDLNLLGRLGAQFNIPALEEMKSTTGEKVDGNK
jgi:hypothetical protein